MTTLHSFVRQVPGARELANKAAGILVFPSVIKAGIGIGGEYGEGILLNQQRVVGYYNLDLGVVRLSAWRAGAVGHHHVHDPGRPAPDSSRGRDGRSASMAR